MYKKILIIANPVSGKGEAPRYATQLARKLKTKHSTEIDIRLTQKESDATKWSQSSYQEGYELVISIGGDGTINESISGLMQIPEELRPIFSFIPLGTVNDLARAVGISLNPNKAINQFNRMAIKEIDVGQVNNQFFCNVIAIGTIPEFVMNTDAAQKNRLGVFAYIKDGVQGFFSHKGYHLELTDHEQHVQEINTNLVVIALTNSVGGMEFAFAGATYDDGLLHLAAVDGHRPFNMINAVLEMSMDNLTNNDLENLIQMQSTSFVIKNIEKEQVATNVDGDQGPDLPLDIRVHPRGLKVLCPK